MYRSVGTNWIALTAVPEVLAGQVRLRRGKRRGGLACGRWWAAAAVALLEHAVEIGAPDAHPPPHVDRGQLPGVDPLSGVPGYADQVLEALILTGGRCVACPDNPGGNGAGRVS